MIEDPADGLRDQGIVKGTMAARGRRTGNEARILFEESLDLVLPGIASEQTVILRRRSPGVTIKLPRSRSFGQLIRLA